MACLGTINLASFRSPVFKADFKKKINKCGLFLKTKSPPTPKKHPCVKEC